MNKDTIERAVGALIGSIVGDALGAPFEFGPADVFRHRFPERLLLDPSEMVGGGQWERAEWTDDTQMALLVAESLLDRSGLDEAHLFGRFVEWCRSSPKDVGVQTRSVLTSGRPWQTAAAEHFARSAKGAGNGSLMRSLPGALYFAGADRAVSADAARRISALTHGDPAAGEGCVLYHELVRVALEGGDPVDGIDGALALVKAEHGGKWAPYVTSGYDPHCDPMSNGAVWPALGAAVWALRTTSTFEDAVLAAINLGNDTDTVACITGGLAGAVYSIGAIPSRWTTYLHGQLVGRADSGIGLAELEALAGNLLNGCRKPSLSPPPEHTVEPQRVDDDVPLYAASYPGVAAALKGGRLPKGALVISLSRTEDAVAAYRPHRQVWMLDQDTPGANMAIDTVLDDVVATIDAALTAGQPVVLHCHGGRSRTGLGLRAWLLARNPGMSVKQATAEMHHRWRHLDTRNHAFTTALTRWADRGARPGARPAPGRSEPKPYGPGPESARTTTGPPTWTMRFDRRISAGLLGALGEDGWLHPLVARRTAQPTLLDLQGRRAGSGQRCWVSLYAGLSSVLDIDEEKGRFRLRTHPSYQRVGSFDPSWSSWRSPEELERQWAQVDGYLDRVLADTEILPRYLNREGQVHPLLCAGLSQDYRIIQREAVIAFPNAALRQAAVHVIESSIHKAIAAAGRAEPWWPGIRDRGKLPSLGIETDLLGIDPRGRLLVIEAKPAPELKGIVWAPAQVALYAELFSQLLATEPDAAGLLDEMLAQRVELGLTAPGDDLTQPVRVAPIVAIGPGPLPPAALHRLAAVAAAIGDAVRNEAVDPLEVWLLDSHGAIERQWLPQGEARSARTSPAAPAAAAAGSFVAAARAAANAWKQQSSTLPPPARDPAPYRGVGPAYPFCLPITYSTLNLLPDARSNALERFQAAGIPWHHGIAGGPSNHLLSSQVQCANALAPFVDRPDVIARLFEEALPIAEVLPFGATTQDRFDASDHLVFEWIGVSDYLGERGGLSGTRGANTTSADAAIRYRAHDGRTEIALIEWKYTEQYRGHELGGGTAAMDVRRARYSSFWSDPASPVRTDLIPYDDLFVEPFYQLFRLQLLAWRMEHARELGADIVRLLYVAPATNTQLATSFNRPSHRLDGSGPYRTPEASTVWQVWSAMQRRPDRFAFLGSAALVARDAATSVDFRHRYGHIGVPGVTPPAKAAVGDLDRLREACSTAISILARVSGDGGVLTQIASMSDDQLRRAAPNVVAELASRLEEIAELTRLMRAEDASEILSRSDGPE